MQSNSSRNPTVPPLTSASPSEHTDPVRIAWHPFSEEGPESLPPLRPHAVQVWCAHLPDWQPLQASFDRLLSDAERTRASQLRFAHDRSLFVLGHGLLRLLAARDLDRVPSAIQFEDGPAGKPFVADVEADYDINLSHSGNWVLVATGHVPNLGVDVERHNADVDPSALASSVFSEWEREQLRAMPSSLQTSLFFDLWTRKEAVIKGDGRGVGMGLDRFDVEFRPDHPPRVRHIDGDTAHRWTLRPISLAPGYSAAVACRATPRSLSLYRIHPPSSRPH